MTEADDVKPDEAAASRAMLVRSIAASPLAARIDPQSVVKEESFAPRSATGQTYRIIVTNEMDAYDKPVAFRDMFETRLDTLAVTGDNFSGTDRRSAKLSLGSGPVEDFADLQDLIATLPSIDKMTHHNPHITQVWNSRRVVEEERNVHLRVWLYAASREKDNDFHLILGRALGLAPVIYMTMELSGLPPEGAPSLSALKGARDAYKHFFGNHMPGGTYHFYDPPIPVEVEGSLFFDITHSGGQRPGPEKLRDHMPTIWEVHPISSITFEP